MEGDPKTWFELIGNGGSFTLLGLLLFWLTMKLQPQMTALFERAQAQQQAASEKASQAQIAAVDKLAAQFMDEKNQARSDFKAMLDAERAASAAERDAHRRTMDRVVVELQRLTNLMLLLYSKSFGQMSPAELALVDPENVVEPVAARREQR